ncbi:hypothetical protein O3P69_018965 [Scylla paramamosain]|uniref:RING-type domain-containing protein n=1 Tax=Scylla paramamosain TaxID=85552 RepID=A0AAW0SA35_SCYPA
MKSLGKLKSSVNRTQPSPPFSTLRSSSLRWNNEAEFDVRRGRCGSKAEAGSLKEGQQARQDDSLEDCPICHITFDDTLRRPRTLPCGHTLCTPCINELKEQGAVKCPICRASHAVPEMGQFPISYITEGFIKRLRGSASLPPKPGKQAPPPVTQPSPKAITGLSRRAQSLLQEQELKVLAAIRSCEEEQSQLADYLTTLIGWDSRQQRMEDELQTLVDQSKSAREVVRREVSRVKGKQEEVQQREQQLNATLQALRMATTRHEAYEIIEDAAHLAEEDSQRTKDFLGMFPDVHAVTTVAKVAEASRAALQAAAAASASIQAALEAAGTTAAAVGDSSLPATLAEASSIADRLQVLLTPPLTTEDLFSLRQPAKGMVEAGLVFAVHEVEGRSRYARISLEDGRLHLHSLQAQAPPSCAVTLQMVEVVPAGPPCEVFMDLEWPGSAARRVVVVRGLEVVVAAARHRPITEVTVEQCGVLLSR